MEMKREYYEDIQYFKKKWVMVVAAVFILLLFTIPIYFTGYSLFILNLIMVYVIVAVGLNILVGYTGQISIGHAGFFAVGAYAMILMMTLLHMPFILALVLSGFISAFFGFLLGLPSLRVKGPYLAIVTLGFGMTIMHIIGQANLFGGRLGLQAPPLNVGVTQLGLSWILTTDVQKFYLILIITIIMVVAARNIMKTRIGRAFVAIRDDDIAAEVNGVDLLIYKTLSFAISAFYAGVGGGLFSFVLSFVEPFQFNVLLSIIFLVMIIVGGLGSIVGSIVGAVLITFLQYSLLKNVRELPVLGDWLVAISQKWFTVIGLENFNSMILGIIIALIIIFEPKGINGIWLRFKKYCLTWPFK
jgi:branched-chain amino acid transport system permease protein